MYVLQGLAKLAALQELTDTDGLIVASDDYSDSGNLDCVLEILSLTSGRTLAESVLMMIPKAWQHDKTLMEHERSFYQYHSCVMEPWDGPAMVAFTDGDQMGAVTMAQPNSKPNPSLHP